MEALGEKPWIVRPPQGAGTPSFGCYTEKKTKSVSAKPGPKLTFSKNTGLLNEWETSAYTSGMMLCTEKVPGIASKMLN